jgi:hypothetical protein
MGSAVGPGYESAVTSSDGVGRFVFRGVPAGDYEVNVLLTPRIGTRPPSELFLKDLALGHLLTIREGKPQSAPGKLRPPPPDPTFFAAVPVTVSDSDREVDVAVVRAARVSGRVSFEGSAVPPKLESVRISVHLRPAEPSSFSQLLPGWVSERGEFSTYGAPPGRYFLSVISSGLPNWLARSAIYQGLDRLDHPIELGSADLESLTIRFTDLRAQLRGTVTTAASPAPQGRVLVFSTDESFWAFAGESRRIVKVRTTNTGTYATSNLPPGDYFVIAMAAGSAEFIEDWPSSAELARLAKVARRVTLRDGQTATLDLATSTLR